MMHGEGVSKEGDLLDLAVKEGIIEKAGSWYSYNNLKMGQGRDNAKEFLVKEPAIFLEVKTLVLKNHGMVPAAPASEPKNDSEKKSSAKKQ
jgi:recombination protein RecA